MLDLSGNKHLPSYPNPLVDQRPAADALFDTRAAAVVMSIVVAGVRKVEDLLEFDNYNGHFASLPLLSPKCLAAMAYKDYFPEDTFGNTLRALVSDAIVKAAPGFCGTFGPGVDGATSLTASEGNYDMRQMHLLPLAYAYYDCLPDAREHLITVLLGQGRIHRPNLDDTFTSGGVPNDWMRAGYLSPLAIHVDIPETENHVLMIQTVRYLTNQLLYPRDHDRSHDNRRNGDPGDSRPSCIELLLTLLRGYLRDDFAEYNANPYQDETRRALNCLYTYAYDTEVRVAARMVLDYISARVAVSSNDLRRLVPFRRLNEGSKVKQIEGQPGFMDITLLDSEPGGDTAAQVFALLAGNTRAYEATRPSGPQAPWSITPFPEYAHTVITDYRIAPSIHDLFVND